MLHDWRLRLRSLLRRGEVERELDAELRFHLEQAAAKYERQGLARAEARRRARLDLGGEDQIREEHRDSRGTALFEDAVRDLHGALRQARRAPSVAALAVVCLGLGVGVNTAIFSVADALLRRPLPVRDADRVVTIARGGRGGFPYARYEAFRDRAAGFDGITTSFPVESDLEVGGRSAFIASEVSAPNYADVLGLHLELGRWFTSDSVFEAVISDAVWRRSFDGSPDAIGRVLLSQTQSYVVVGVAPDNFTGLFAPLRTDLWVPLRTRPAIGARLDSDQALPFIFLGRLRPGVSPAQSASGLTALDARLPAPADVVPGDRAPVTVTPVRGTPNAGYRRLSARLLGLMSAVVMLILVIACVNVGGLLLARGATRQHELAVRRALGASPGRLVRQLLTESLLLAAAGALCGVLFAFWTTALIQRTFPESTAGWPLRLDLRLDLVSLMFATLASLVAALACAMVPAWRASRGPGSPRGATFSGHTRRPIGLVAQIALSLVLLFLAGSFLQGVRDLQTIDPGFAVSGRLYAYVYVPATEPTPGERLALYGRAVDRVRTLPGLRNAAIASSLPLMPTPTICASTMGGLRLETTANDIGPGYFDVMGIRLVAGREFEDADAADGPAEPVIVSESFARRAWPDGAALGERVLLGCDSWLAASTSPRAATVIGVARDTAIRAVGDTTQPHVYRRFTPQDATALTAILVDAGTGVGALAPRIHDTLLESAPGLRIYTVEPLDRHVRQSYAQFQWITGLVAAFGALALLLASIGLYGAIAYRVALRTREIGLRMALGATRRAVFRDVLVWGVSLALLGVGTGEVATAGLTGVAGALAQGIAPAGVWVHVLAAVAWLAVALAACYRPAARASRVDPMAALRCE